MGQPSTRLAKQVDHAAIKRVAAVGHAGAVARPDWTGSLTGDW
jgi:hypothetical protein